MFLRCWRWLGRWRGRETRSEGVGAGDGITADSTTTDSAKASVRLDFIELSPNTVVYEDLEVEPSLNLGSEVWIFEDDGLESGPSRGLVVTNPGAKAPHLNVEADNLLLGMDQSIVLVGEDADGRGGPRLIPDILTGVAKEIEFTEEGFCEDFGGGDCRTGRLESAGSGVVLGDGGAYGLDSVLQVLEDVGPYSVA